MIIVEDVANKLGKHDLKHKSIKALGHNITRLPLPVGDYILLNQKVYDVVLRKNKRGVAIKKMDLLGTYDKCIDTKFSIQELIGDICGQQHERFRDECILAQNNGIKLIILVEDNGGYCDMKETIYNKPVTCVSDLFSWKNPRAFIFQGGKQKYPKATKGQALAKSLITMQKKYGCEFVFTRKEKAGAEIVRLLTRKGDES